MSQNDTANPFENGVLFVTNVVACTEWKPTFETAPEEQVKPSEVLPQRCSECGCWDFEQESETIETTLDSDGYTRAGFFLTFECSHCGTEIGKIVYYDE